MKNLWTGFVFVFISATILVLIIIHYVRFGTFILPPQNKDIVENNWKSSNDRSSSHEKLLIEINKIEFQYIKFDTIIEIEDDSCVKLYHVTMYIDDENMGHSEFYLDGIICEVSDTSIYPTITGRPIK